MVCTKGLGPCAPGPACQDAAPPSLSALRHASDYFPSHERATLTLHTPQTMASGRSLGGGRILGSGRSLSPAVPPAKPSAAQHTRNPSYLSPSGSSISVSSQTSESPAPSANTEDLLSKVSLDHVDNGAQAAASSRLVCPICNEEMVW